MDFNLPADAEEMRVATRDAVDALLKLEPRYHETGEVPEQVESTLREMGFYGMAIPEAYGGMRNYQKCLTPIVSLTAPVVSLPHVVRTNPVSGTSGR